KGPEAQPLDGGPRYATIAPETPSDPEDSSMTAPLSPRRLPAALVCLLALALCALALPGVAQEKKDTKKDDKKTETKKDDTKKVDTKKGDKKDTKKDDKPKEEKKDERISPPVEPVLEIKGHTDWVNRVAFTPDGQHLVTASRDKSLRIW